MKWTNFGEINQSINQEINQEKRKHKHYAEKKRDKT